MKMKGKKHGQEDLILFALQSSFFLHFRLSLTRPEKKNNIEKILNSFFFCFLPSSIRIHSNYIFKYIYFIKNASGTELILILFDLNVD